MLPTFHLKVEREDTNDKFWTNFAISRNASTTKRRNYESEGRKEWRLVIQYIAETRERLQSTLFFVQKKYV